MERIGDDNASRGLLYFSVSVEACQGAPVTIERGAVVAMAVALDDLLSEYTYIVAESEWDMDNWDNDNQSHASYLINSAEAALLAYYGDSNE